MEGDSQASWVLEFLLLEPVGDRIVNCLFRALPFAFPLHPRIRHVILLRRISSELSRRTVTENTLTSLELLDELRRADGGAGPSDALKSAYAAVVVHLTVVAGLSGDVRVFEDVVERIWRRRVGDLCRSKVAAGLVSILLGESMEKMKEAVLDQKSREAFLKKDTLEEALVAMGLFLWESLDSFGPSFVDFLDFCIEREGARGELFDHPLAKIHTTGNLNKLSGDVEMGIDSVKEDSKCDPSLLPGNGGSSFQEFHVLPSSEVQRAMEDLRTSSFNLQAVVRNPLPDAINASLAGNGLSDFNEDEVVNQEILEVDEVACNSSPEDVTSSNEVAQNTKYAVRSFPSPTNPEPVEKDIFVDQDIRVSASLAENGLDIGQKRPACTYKSLKSSTNKSPKLSKKLRLPEQKERMVSPLSDVKIKGVVQRRKVTRWSVLEEDTLREGVGRYGRGNWKTILNNYPDVFYGRTEVDLKDKWRNMTK